MLVRVLALQALREPSHVALVRSRGLIVAHEDRGQARAGAGYPELLELFVHMLGELLGERVPVDHRPCHATSSRRRLPTEPPQELLLVDDLDAELHGLIVLGARILTLH